MLVEVLGLKSRLLSGLGPLLWFHDLIVGEKSKKNEFREFWARKRKNLWNLKRKGVGKRILEKKEGNFEVN